MPSSSGSSSSRRSGDSSAGGKGKPRSNSKPGGSGKSGSKGKGGGAHKSDGRRPQRRDDKPKPPPRAETSGWGSVAQHGAAGATHGQKLDEADGPRTFSADERRKFEERQAKRDKAAARVEGLRDEARAAIQRSDQTTPPPIPKSRPIIQRRPLPGRPPKPRDVHKELTKVHGKDRGDRSWRLFRRAAGEFEREQFQDAERTLKPLVEANPGLADMRELYGLALYRLGKWDLAMEQLEQFRAEAGTVEQHPVLMDLHRALGNWGDVDELWAELGEVSPDAALMSEGRIVAAGTAADRGNVDEGIRILEKGWKIPAKPLEHHLRRAYALADLYERRGKIPRARKLFNWLAGVSPPFGDAQDRARSLD